MTEKRRDDLGDRMKRYERRETDRKFLPYIPVYARIDGRGYSKLTKNMLRPFDLRMTNLMIETTKALAEETNAIIGYCQSDEISLVWKSTNSNQEIFFDGKVQKMTSVLSGIATSAFIDLLDDFFPDDAKEMRKKRPHFDARVFQLPNEQEATNVFLSRELDATKNAISMAAHHYFSHKSLQGVSGADMQEKLFQEKGINFNDYPACFKRGTFVRRTNQERELSPDELLRIPEKHRPLTGQKVVRSLIKSLDMPRFSKVTNRVDVIFGNAEPIMV